MIEDFSLWKLHWNTIDHLITKLPGKTKKSIFTHSRLPNELLQELENHSNYESIFLLEADTCRYSEELIDYFQSKSQKFFVMSLGYKHRKICDNAYELAVNTWYPKIYKPLKIKSSETKIFYGCLNRGPRFHRTWLGLKLWQNNLLKRIIYSIHHVDGCADYLLKKLENETGWAEFLSQLPIKHLAEDGQYNDHSTEHPAYDTLCNIVTECETEYFGFDSTWPTPVTTEKTWKPFLSGQIPLFLAPQGHLEYVKSFGFDVFEEILPSDYDSMNTFDKVDAIVDIVKNCAIEDIYFNNLDRIRSNYNLLVSGSIEKQVEDSVLNFVYNN